MVVVAVAGPLTVLICSVALSVRSSSSPRDGLMRKVQFEMQYRFSSGSCVYLPSTTRPGRFSECTRTNPRLQFQHDKGSSKACALCGARCVLGALEMLVC